MVLIITLEGFLVVMYGHEKGILSRKVRKWLDASNHLVLNIDKTNFVIFHSSQKNIVDLAVHKIEKIHNEIFFQIFGCFA